MLLRNAHVSCHFPTQEAQQNTPLCLGTGGSLANIACFGLESTATTWPTVYA